VFLLGAEGSGGGSGHCTCQYRDVDKVFLRNPSVFSFIGAEGSGGGGVCQAGGE